METQTCICCSVTKPLSEYYKHPRMANGRLGRCKECHKKETTRNRNENLDRIRCYDRRRNKTEGRKAMHANKQRAKRKTMGRDYGRAHNVVSWAVKNGTLIRPDHCHRCLIQCPAQAHHDDHSRPLEIMWLCPVCHAQRHVELAKIKLQTKEN